MPRRSNAARSRGSRSEHLSYAQSESSSDLDGGFSFSERVGHPSAAHCISSWTVFERRRSEEEIESDVAIRSSEPVAIGGDGEGLDRGRQVEKSDEFTHGAPPVLRIVSERSWLAARWSYWSLPAFDDVNQE